jgi:SAM-dependent methyltransferase
VTSSGVVGALYDALLAFEGGRRAEAPYPVHKPIVFPATNHDDVYEWLADELHLKATDRVLDIGCGVGFGTLRLSDRGVAHSTGLTISHAEAQRAARSASRCHRPHAIAFVEGSFDRPPEGTFDVIVAVESLKHSSDLGGTLRALDQVLAPGGRLAVVEDLFEGDSTCASARRVVGDWLLAKLYGQADYVAALPSASWRVIDLTAGVRRSPQVVLAGKLAALNLALAPPASPHSAALRAFRGGLHLERLYAAGMMRYAALFATKGAPESR